MVNAQLDRLIHPTLRVGTPENVRLARLTAAIACVMFALGASSIVAIAAASTAEDASRLVLTTGAYALALGLLRFRANRKAAANLIVAALTLTTIDFVFRQDGTRSTGTSWMALGPLLAVLFLGRRTATMWTVLALGALAALAVAELTGHRPPSSADLGVSSTIGRAVMSAFLLLVLVGVATAFDTTKEQMADELARERGNVERARDEAAEAHGAARRVLDAVDQALFTVSPDGTVSDELSAAAARWLGTPERGETVTSWLGRSSPESAKWIELAYAQHHAGILPPELTAAQMPSRLVIRGRTYAFRWLPTEHPGELLAVGTDVTDAIEAARAEETQREIVALLARCVRDPDSVSAFVAETDELVEQIERARATDRVVLARRVHTLKGNAGVFGLTRLAELCDEVEARMMEANGEIAAADRAAIGRAWRELHARMMPFLEADPRSIVRVPRPRLERMIASIERGAPTSEVRRELRAWTLESTRVRLERAAEQARALAERLGRGPIEVSVSDGDLVLPPEPWEPFWSALTHAIRNAVDHGLRPPEERARAGKPPCGRLWLETRLDGAEIVVTVRDDGEGIDWSGIGARARERGLPHGTSAELIDALFADGLSTAAGPTEISGRGVGLAALREVTERIGGHVVVHSRRGAGTTFEFRIPAADPVRSAA